MAAMTAVIMAESWEYQQVAVTAAMMAEKMVDMSADKMDLWTVVRMVGWMAAWLVGQSVGWMAVRKEGMWVDWMVVSTGKMLVEW